MKKFLKKRNIIIGIILIVLMILGIVLYNTVYLDYKSDIKMKLIGKEEVVLNLDDEYKEQGSKAIFRKDNITNKIKTEGIVDNKKVGEYIITYKVKYKKHTSTLKRKVIVKDTIIPTIELNGDESIFLYKNAEYKELGARANDNYDGDITDKIEINHNIDMTKVGNYEVTYTVKDSSGNENSIKRKIEVKEKPVYRTGGVAVLNYHFFYAPGESCGQGICLRTDKFEEQLKYLKDNGYKTLTMEEFRSWIYGEIDVPEKSVLLTIDDGAMGTGKHNGNKLIPLLEKYQAHATLFLITGWWSIENYRSPYLDIESHTNDMHLEGRCSGVSRGAQLLCSSHDEVIADLNKSIAITGSKKAFCYPFYAYNDAAIEEVKEVGFALAFAGGNRKATRSSNKYAVPRYPIQSNITLDTFVNYIS